MKKGTLFFGLIISALCIGFVSCATDEDTPEPVEPSLYQDLGGTEMVIDPITIVTDTATNDTIESEMIERGRLVLRSVVDSTIFVIAADGSLSPFFAQLLSELNQDTANTTNLAILSKNFTDFFCVATGAENFTYEGMGMIVAHDPSTNPRMSKKVNNTDFSNFTNAVRQGALQAGVSNKLTTELIILTETLREDIVQRQ